MTNRFRCINHFSVSLRNDALVNFNFQSENCQKPRQLSPRIFDGSFAKFYSLNAKYQLAKLFLIDYCKKCYPVFRSWNFPLLSCNRDQWGNKVIWQKIYQFQINNKKKHLLVQSQQQKHKKVRNTSKVSKRDTKTFRSRDIFVSFENISHLLLMFLLLTLNK